MDYPLYRTIDVVKEVFTVLGYCWKWDKHYVIIHA